MNKPSIRARLIEARTYLTHARVQIQTAEAAVPVGDEWIPISAALLAAQDAERKIRYALDSMPEEGETETEDGQ